MASKTYHGVTEEIFKCVKTKSHSEHGTIYDPPTGNKGTATTSIPVLGKIVLGYDLQPNRDLTYTIIEKPGLAPEGEIWSGIEKTINGCR